MRSLFGLLAFLSACGTPQFERSTTTDTCPKDMVVALQAEPPERQTVIVRLEGKRPGRCHFVRKAQHAQR